MIVQQQISPVMSPLCNGVDGGANSPSCTDVFTDFSAPSTPGALSHTSENSNSINKKKKDDVDLCLICGDRASGYHYNALSCEGCKGFFRRSITREAKYTCKTGGNCEMDMWMRRKCQYCRLRRCREVGMRAECLLSEEQCKARMTRRKTKLRKKRDHHDSSESSDVQPDSGGVRNMPYRQVALIEDNPLELLCDKHRGLIERTVFLQERYELPSSDDDKLPHLQMADCTDSSQYEQLLFMQMSIATLQTTHLVVEYAKELPGFQELDRKDQIMLLKGSASEVMMLRTARRYDVKTDAIIFSDGTPFTKEKLRIGGLADFTDIMYDFCRAMGQMFVDNAEYALLTAVCIFSERPGVEDIRKVEKFQQVYLETLRAYVDAKQRRYPAFARLLMKLTDLRTLSDEHSKVLKSLSIQRKSLPPLLSEYFDLH